MITRLRLLVVAARPAVVFLLAVVALVGVARGGRAADDLLGLAVLVPVVAFLAFAVLVNDLADVAVDRVNLPGDRRRALVAGWASRRDVVASAAVAALLALGSAALLGPVPVAAVAGGLVFAAAYSLPPARLSGRGLVASLTLPLGYVAVPFFVGLGATGAVLGGDDALVLAGLYLGFVGRLLLKDFRDVRGDALFGKRTTLVRHGRRVTCLIGGVCLTSGAALLVASSPRSPGLAAAVALLTVAMLALLRELAVDGGHRRDERLVGAVAVVGRGLLVAVLAEAALTQAGWAAPGRSAALTVVALASLGLAADVRRRGPRQDATVRVWGWAPARSSTSS